MQDAAMALAKKLNNEEAKQPGGKTPPPYCTVEQTKVGAVLNDNLPFDKMKSLITEAGAKYLWDIVSFQFATKFADCAKPEIPHVVTASKVKEEVGDEAKCKTFRAIEGREMINRGQKKVISHIFEAREGTNSVFDGPVRLLSLNKKGDGHQYSKKDTLSAGDFLLLETATINQLKGGEFSEVIGHDGGVGVAITSEPGKCHKKKGDQTCVLMNVGIYDPEKQQTKQSTK